MRSGSIVIIGSATIDTIVQDASTFHKIGGVATYGGITFRRHGLDATVLSNIAATDTAIFNLYRNYKIRLFNGLTLTTTSILRYAPAVRKERCRLQQKYQSTQAYAQMTLFDSRTNGLTIKIQALEQGAHPTFAVLDGPELLLALLKVTE